jgi:hypothetical protein
MGNKAMPLIAAAVAMVCASSALAADRPAPNPMRNAYFGAVHIHTGYSFDALTNGTITTPSNAYEWAQGKPIPASKFEPDKMMKIVTPLDFYAVADHAEFMGVFNKMADPNDPLSKTELAKRITSSDPNTAVQAFAEVLRDMSAGKTDPMLTDPAVSRTVWAEIVKTADAYYRPGSFTTFPAFEWTSNPNKRNLHRVVVFRDSKHLPDLVLSALDTEKPEDLWAWMQVQRRSGSTLLAIPHNANASDGLMFSMTDSSGKPLSDAYNAERARNEPLYEISQIKGTSETHPDLSPNDEFASFELWDYTLSADSQRPEHRDGSFVRRALLDGLLLSSRGKGNPFKYGFIGDSDTHNAAASNEEFNYTGKFGIESDPKHRLNGLQGQPPGQIQQVREFSSGGLAGVWAQQNTRESIYDAMARRETFGTSGTHIKVRFFGGWDFRAADVGGREFVQAGYARGVPMGGDLPTAAPGKAPSFMVWAIKDPLSGNLDRIQIVKGWVDAGGTEHEKIYDVAWSDNRKPDAKGEIPAVGDTVDAKTGSYRNSIGSPELSAVWKDPEFDAAVNAFYYARVIEIPTPRWSTRDAAKLGVEIPGGLPVSIQERAWSSPIWYSPR